MSVSLFYQLRRNYKYVDVDSKTRQEYINYLNAEVENTNYNVTKKEIRKLLEDELDFHNYIYKEGEVKVTTNSAYSIALLRYIKVDMDKCGRVEDYCIALCHEMCHVKYFTGNEVYTNFLAFKTLYESENETLKNIGTWFGIYTLNRCYVENYDCSQLIVDYLRNLVDKT
jgi:NAD-dependent dihydropyrimidine dehydrogenase PreA subunit